MVLQFCGGRWPRVSSQVSFGVTREGVEKVIQVLVSGGQVKRFWGAKQGGSPQFLHPPLPPVPASGGDGRDGELTSGVKPALPQTPGFMFRDASLFLGHIQGAPRARGFGDEQWPTYGPHPSDSGRRYY
jgi:hypothetical protein